jgi:hypothetical protein
MCKAVTMINKICMSLTVGFVIPLSLVGCSSNPSTKAGVIEKPVPVPCVIAIPRECKPAYAVDRVSTRDDPLTINRALRAEIEERSACEIKLIAAVKGCDNRISAENGTN